MATLLQGETTISGQYNSVPFAFALRVGSEDVSAVQILDVSVTKAATPAVWIGGELTYTVTVTNNDTALPLTNLVLTDILDPVLTAFVAGSVAINGTDVPTADVSYAEASGLLTVQVPNIAESQSAIITFRVTQK